MSTEHNFLFASLNSKQPLTSRAVHIRRLYDLLELCRQRNDFVRAKRAWAILVRCKEFRWEEHWTIGLWVLTGSQPLQENVSQRVEYLHSILVRDIDKEAILKELVVLLIMSHQYRKALDELELYLPSFPFQDDPTLHIYAGLLSLHIAQSTTSEVTILDPSLLRNAQAHLNQARSLDSSNTLAYAFLQRINDIQKENTDNISNANGDSEDENMTMDGPSPRRKRIRT